MESVLGIGWITLRLKWTTLLIHYVFPEETDLRGLPIS
jgi:hypothetical protein